MKAFLTLILFQPVFNALVFLYVFIPGRDFGIAVIVLTLLFRFAFYPLSASAIRAQKKLAKLQPKIKEIQEKFKGKRDEQGKAMLELYKTENVNPFAAILPLLIQLPLLITLYQVFWRGFQPEQLALLYTFIPNPGAIDPHFLGVVDLSQKSLIIAILAGIFQYIQTKQITPKREPGKKDFASAFQTQMLYIFPAVTVLIVSQLPSAIGVYWIVTSLFSIAQHVHVTNKMEKEEAS